jgi:hypothetical protein
LLTTVAESTKPIAVRKKKKKKKKKKRKRKRKRKKKKKKKRKKRKKKKKKICRTPVTRSIFQEALRMSASQEGPTRLPPGRKLVEVLYKHAPVLDARTFCTRGKTRSVTRSLTSRFSCTVR